MKKNCVLSIDTSKTNETKVTLDVDGVLKEKDITSPVHTAQHVIPFIEALCKEQDVTIEDITDIRVHTGPGSYTGLRVGVAIANAIGFLLHIPVNGKDAPITKLQYGDDKW